MQLFSIIVAVDVVSSLHLYLLKVCKYRIWMLMRTKLQMQNSMQCHSMASHTHLYKYIPSNYPASFIPSSIFHWIWLFTKKKRVLDVPKHLFTKSQNVYCTNGWRQFRPNIYSHWSFAFQIHRTRFIIVSVCMHVCDGIWVYICNCCSFRLHHSVSLVFLHFQKNKKKCTIVQHIKNEIRPRKAEYKNQHIKSESIR